MNKGLQIFLLILLFAIGFGGGYVIEDMLLGNKEKSQPKYDQGQEKEYTDKELGDESDEAKSTVPVIDGKPTPKRSANNTYSFTAKATVESGDNLMYELYKDANCTSKEDDNLDGEFSNIPYPSTGKYYLRVVNARTNDVSEVCEISGFVYVKKYTKLQPHEIEYVVNNLKNFSAASDDFKERVANKGLIKVTVTNLRSDEREVHNLPDVCSKVLQGFWTSITVSTPSYDEQGRLTGIVITANHNPEMYE